MKEYTPEELKKLNIEPDNVNNIIDNTPIDQNQIQKILDEPRQKPNTSTTSEDEREKLFTEMGKPIKDTDQTDPFQEIFDDKKDFYCDVDKGTLKELFFKTLIKRIPELGISIEDNSKFPDGTPREDVATINSTPHLTDREFIYSLEHHPVISFFSNNLVADLVAKELGANKILTKEIIDRVQARGYQDEINKNKKLLKKIPR